MKQVWPDAFVEEANLARNIYALRKVLGDDNGEHRFVETVPKLGYRFVAPVTEVGDETAPVLLHRQVRAKIISEEEETSDAPQFVTKVKGARPSAVLKRKFAVGLLVLAVLGSILSIVVWKVWQSRRATPPARINSIAVLPLRSLSDDEKNNALGLGLTDALIAKLGSLRTVAVRPTSAVAKFVKSDLDALEIGRRLQVDAVMEGTIQQSEGRIRISARLLRVEGGDQIWAERFDEPTNEIFALEDALSNRITNALAFELDKSDRERFARRATENAVAYEKYLLGRFYQNQNTEQGFQKSIEFYEQAIALDPAFAEGYAGIADANVLLYNFGLRPKNEVVPKATQSVNRALQLNPNLPAAYCSLALIQFLSDHDWKAAEQSLRKAIELDPNNADAFLRYGYFLIQLGRFDEALAKLQKARELNPLSPIVQTDTGMAHLFAHQYPQAIDQLEKAAADNPDFPLAQWLLGRAYAGINDTEKSFAADLRGMETSGERDLANRLRDVRNAQGFPAAYQLWLDQWLKAEKTGSVSALSIASLYATLKNREETLNWLEKAVAEDDLTLSQIKYLADYDFVRDDERFTRLLQKIAFKES